MSNWLDTLLESVKESEAPERYFWWSGLCAISAVLRKKVYLDRIFYKLYPNIYVALLSARSGNRKGAPVSLIKDLVEDLDSIRVISGCNSIQGLIKELSMQQTFQSGHVIGEAQGLMVSDEFESFLTEDPRALTYLTALYNTHEHEKSWKKRLRNSPLEELKSPCLTLLIASNEALFESVIRDKDIKGGFIARTFIVHESKKRQLNSLMYTKEEATKIKDRIKDQKLVITQRLKEVEKLSGEIVLSSQSSKLFDSWYKELGARDYEDQTGTYDRLGDQVLKCAMLISISESDELIITKNHIELAIEKSELCLPGVRSISMEKQKSDTNSTIELMLKELIKSPEQKVTRKKLMISTHIEAMLLDRAIDTLIQRDAITQGRNEKREIFYQMKPETYKKYVQFEIAEEGN